MTRHDRPVAVVTGGNRGIGLETCRQLAARGMTVVLTARDHARATAAAAELSGRGEVRAEPLDVADEGSVLRLAARLEADLGRVDALVNNAAINYDVGERTVSVDLGDVRRTLQTNLFGAWRTVQVFLPLLRAAERPRVVNVSSGAGALTGMGGGTPAYSVSKAALNALTLMLADELRRDRILVNAVCPGWVATDMGGPGGRPVSEGAAGVVWAATLPDDGPTGGFFRDGRPIPW